MYLETFNPPRRPGTERCKKSIQHDHFRCLHCGAEVHTMPLFSGVQNRNHCPFCLWSRHVDYQHPGDRMSACRAVMQPIALTVKQTHNKYASRTVGELMLVHRCDDCNKLSINRIAADDQAAIIELIYRASFSLDLSIRWDLEQAYIHPLQVDDETMLFTQLYGIYSPS
jgi:hypothetical protein